MVSQYGWALRLQGRGRLRLAVLVRGRGLWKADSMLQTAGRLGTQPKVRPPFVPYLLTSPKYRDTLRPSCQSLSSVHWHSIAVEFNCIMGNLRFQIDKFKIMRKKFEMGTAPVCATGEYNLYCFQWFVEYSCLLVIPPTTQGNYTHFDRH